MHFLVIFSIETTSISLLFSIIIKYRSIIFLIFSKPPISICFLLNISIAQYILAFISKKYFICPTLIKRLQLENSTR